MRRLHLNGHLCTGMYACRAENQEIMLWLEWNLLLANKSPYKHCWFNQSMYDWSSLLASNIYGFNHSIHVWESKLTDCDYLWRREQLKKVYVWKSTNKCFLSNSDMFCIDLGIRTFSSPKTLMNRMKWSQEPCLQPVWKKFNHVNMKYLSMDFNVTVIICTTWHCSHQRLPPYHHYQFYCFY